MVHTNYIISSLQLRFIFVDLYANDMFTSAETPRGSGDFSRDRVAFTCTKSSPIPCDFTGKNTLPALGYIYSFGQDNNKDLFYLTSKGVYRVVRPSLCGYSCPLEKNILVPPPPSPGISLGLKMKGPVMLVLTCLFVLLSFRI
jgi:hypothetical protein